MGRTVRLYDQDPYATDFEARVAQTLVVEDKPAVILDRTCFYPTSGGQPHDLGWLDGVPVVDVFEDGDEVIHVLEGCLESETVHGRIDWARRRDHMQQHTGQHILSQAFLRVCGAATVGFHLGDDVSTIDLDIADLEDVTIEKALSEANEVVFGDLPITVRVFDDVTELPESVRKAPSVAEDIRIVSVNGYDASACCGTHVRRTGEIGVIHVTRVERAKGQTRVAFVCGRRAAADHWHKTCLCHDLAAMLSCGLEDLPSLVGKVLDDLKAAEKRGSALQERLAAAEAASLRTRAQPLGRIRLVQHVFDELTVHGIRQLAKALIAEDQGLVAILATRSPSPMVCVACGEDTEVPADELLRAGLRPLGGQGGGTASLAQGGGIPVAQLTEALDAAKQELLDESDTEARP